ncbi:MAG TPA: DUF4834 domain-containing protein [Dysgonomonas sp.]|nr:DUF4834 domain-containing protein [Dysgonomonas sp.]
MGTLIFILLMIAVAIFFFGVSFISGIIRLFTKGPDTAGKRYSGGRSQDYRNNSRTDASHQNHKVFSKDEGEYVDFEEIK